VIISESTYDHIQKYSRSFVGDIRFEEREAIVGKGRQQRTRVYEVFRA